MRTVSHKGVPSPKSQHVPAAHKTTAKKVAPVQQESEELVQHEVGPSAIRTTRDSLEIRTWAEKRGGFPALVKGAYSEDESAIWIEFPGTLEARDLNIISWDEWYQRFLERESAFEYQERTPDGELSMYFRVINE